MDRKDLNELIEILGVLDCLKEKYEDKDEELMYNLKGSAKHIEDIIIAND